VVFGIEFVRAQGNAVRHLRPIGQFAADAAEIVFAVVLRFGLRRMSLGQSRSRIRYTVRMEMPNRAAVLVMLWPDL
jgi:hypothetical protein